MFLNVSITTWHHVSKMLQLQNLFKISISQL